jgi:hypothetical protein
VTSNTSFLPVKICIWRVTAVYPLLLIPFWKVPSEWLSVCAEFFGVIHLIIQNEEGKIFIKYLPVIARAWGMMLKFCLVLVVWFGTCRECVAQLNATLLKSVWMSLCWAILLQHYWRGVAAIRRGENSSRWVVRPCIITEWSNLKRSPFEYMYISCAS